MGLFISRAMDALSGLKEKRILLLGLDAAGKTTVLYQLNQGEAVHTVPTVGFNVESVVYKNISFTYWDVGGQGKIRKLWHHYYAGTDAVIFVVDANDASRIEEAKEELFALMDADQLRDCPLLVIANKQDLPHSMTTAEVVNKLDLRKLRSKWHTRGAVATTGAGLYEGLDWLADTFKTMK
jgi:small GTP-binding protein